MAKNKMQRTGFISELDQFLQDFDKNRSAVPDSCQKELEKHRKIAEKRDGIVEDNDSPIWKDF
jgi:hypothetical protein